VSYLSKPSGTYPVVYLLDADLWFGAVTDPTRLLHWELGLPELVIVGIGYGTSWDDVDEFQRLRNIDLTPTNVETIPGSGGTGEFLRFIQEDLFPFINYNYRTNPVDRTIAGLSDGALFSLYVLFHASETFNRYVAFSPHSAWDDRVIFQYEDGFAKESAELPAKLFLAVGSLDRDFASDLSEFHRRLEKRNYAGLEMGMVIMEEETHLSVFPGAFSRGLRTVFQ
jgi:predicted alpha/beta superfamily hydrolase